MKGLWCQQIQTVCPQLVTSYQQDQVASALIAIGWAHFPDDNFTHHAVMVAAAANRWEAHVARFEQYINRDAELPSPEQLAFELQEFCRAGMQCEHPPMCHDERVAVYYKVDLNPDRDETMSISLVSEDMWRSHAEYINHYRNGQQHQVDRICISAKENDEADLAECITTSPMTLHDLLLNPDNVDVAFRKLSDYYGNGHPDVEPLRSVITRLVICIKAALAPGVKRPYSICERGINLRKLSAIGEIPKQMLGFMSADTMCGPFIHPFPQNDAEWAEFKMLVVEHADDIPQHLRLVLFEMNTELVIATTTDRDSTVWDGRDSGYINIHTGACTWGE